MLVLTDTDVTMRLPPSTSRLIAGVWVTAIVAEVEFLVPRKLLTDKFTVSAEVLKTVFGILRIAWVVVKVWYGAKAV